MSQLLPLFLDLGGRRVLLVGGGPVAAAKLGQLLAASADVHGVSPEVCEEIERSSVPFDRRPFTPTDVDGAWLVVAAATPEVNREVAAAAAARRVFVNAVDDPANATAFLTGVVRRDGVSLAISTSGAAPGLTALLREGIDAVLPRDLSAWLEEARRQRAIWRRDGVPMNERRPLLLDALNRLYDRSPQGLRHTEADAGAGPAKAGHYVRDVAQGVADVAQGLSPAKTETGHVSLVGAGPGDPGLLTRRAVARLRAADLVLYDALIDRRVLKLARHAQRFFAGKRAGRQAMTQQTINSVMIRAARRGKRVVRLKGGDPFVFGRGGEEMLALLAAGVTVDVVPGVTSAVAAPALAGIPVTHRDLSSALLIVGGHDEDAFADAVGDVAPNGVTVVVLMGLGRRAALAKRLIDRGWAAGTPAAIIVDASKPSQTVWHGALEELGSERVEIEHDGPGTIVIGEVVALARLEDRGTTKREHHGSR